jgi:hypothetical protein
MQIWCERLAKCLKKPRWCGGSIYMVQVFQSLQIGWTACCRCVLGVDRELEQRVEYDRS